MKAKIFISCGQMRETDEERTARELEGRLREFGFDTYVAVREISLNGLRENLFRQLESSEYFLFIDFKRENVSDGSCPDGVFRGSLFANQELAVASYLGIEALVFQEKGVKKRDGMLQCFQVNEIEFSDRRNLVHCIADVVREKLDKRGWRTDWKNGLSLEMRAAGEYSTGPRRHFHIDVVNKHVSKPALNVCVYLEEILDLESRTRIPCDLLELKWAGSLFPTALIPPGKSRHFDAFHVERSDPAKLRFNILTDFEEAKPLLPCPGRCRLKYSVYSGTFSPLSASYVVDSNGTIEGIAWEVYSP